MPRIHLGVYERPRRATENAARYALEAGCRGFDSAACYGSEREAG